MDGYVRVSQVGARRGESFISPSVQRDQIRSWALANRVQIGEIFEELDESGARADRPKLLEALGRIDSGESQGIVVAKLDRFGRSLVDGLANIDRISAAGGKFISVQDGLDISTPTGKLVLRIMFSMAEWELDRVRANWDTARSRAIARGVHLGGTPIGYRRRPEGRLEPEPRAATVIAEVFRRRAAGETIASLIDFLNKSGLRTSRGASEFVESSLRGILANRVYLGESRSGPHLNTDSHLAIIDEPTWQEAQRPLRFQSNRRTSLLGGLLRCGSCRLKMSVESGVYRNQAHGGTYRCPGRTSAGPCPAPARVRGEEIEGLIEQLVLRASRRRPDTRSRQRTKRAAQELERKKAALTRYRDASGALTALTPENFAAGLTKRQADVEAAALALAAAERAARTPEVLPSDLETMWPSLSIAERRAMLEATIDCVFVSPKSEPITKRAHVCDRGRGPIDAPRRGVAAGVLRAFEPGLGSGARPLAPLRRMSPRRIERELRDWRGAERRWPTYVEFLQAGRAHLFLQIQEYGGASYWAHRLGCSSPPRTAVWSAEVIRGGLRPITENREVWPSAAEFDALGLSGLRRAVIRNGGIAHWAKELRLRPRPGTARRRAA